jgi:hypothetical protein
MELRKFLWIPSSNLELYFLFFWGLLMIILICYSFLILPLFLYNVQNSPCVPAKYITRSMEKLMLTMYTFL